eukprot:30677_1
MSEETQLMPSNDNNKQNIITVHAAKSAAEATTHGDFHSHPVELVEHNTPNANDKLPNDPQPDLHRKASIPLSFYESHKDTIKLILKFSFLLFWIAYSIAAFIIDFKRARILFILELLIITILILKYIYNKCFIGFPTKLINIITNNKCILYTIYTLLFCAVISIIILCTYNDPGRLAALGGLCVFIFGCYICSWNRKKIKWRPVLWGFGLQFTFALIILRTHPGFELFNWLGNVFKTLLDFTLEGSGFVFSYLATGVNSANGEEPFEFASVFAFGVLPTVIFFSALVSVLYYLGALQFIIYYLSIIMQFTLGTSSSESLNAAGNIFVGMTEAPLLIKPFIKTMTRSELHAVMTGGFATIAGSVMAIYIYFGVPASHLLSASVMSAPAALAISKIVYPEDEISPTAQNDKNAGENDANKVLEQIGHGSETNVIEAAVNGAAIAVGLAANIAGMLIAFLGLIGLLNYLFSYWGSLINWDIDFTTLCGYLFYPIAILMGINPKDAQIAGELIGIKVVVNEFVAYKELIEYIDMGSISDRSAIILIYALCGFSNFGSMGIVIGGMTPLAPKRKKDLTELVLSAMISGNIACFMTACIAALIFDPSRYD